MKFSVSIVFFAAIVTDLISSTLAYSSKGSESESTNVATADHDIRFAPVESFLKRFNYFTGKKSNSALNMDTESPQTKDTPVIDSMYLTLNTEKVDTDVSDIDAVVFDVNNTLDDKVLDDYYSADGNSTYYNYGYGDYYSYGNSTYSDEEYDTELTEVYGDTILDHFTVALSSFVTQIIWLQAQPFISTSTSDRESYYLDGGVRVPCPCLLEEQEEPSSFDVAEVEDELDNYLSEEYFDDQESVIFIQHNEQE